MTPAVADKVSGDFALLDELIVSRELWIDRSEEAKAVADHLLETRASMVVLHGPARSGKTELVRRWVTPILARHRRVIYRDSCGTAERMTEPEGESIEFWDGRCLGEEAVRAECVRELARLTTGAAKGHKLVLILNDDALSRLFQLGESVPHVLEDIREIAPIALGPLFQRLARTTSRCGVRLSDAFVAALVHEVAGTSATATITPELVAVLAFELCRSMTTDRELGKEDCDAVGGLTGILEAHLEYVMERLPGIDPQIGWAVLHDVVSATTGQAMDLAEVANRFDVSTDAPSQVVRWLEETRRILRKRDGGYDLVPAQLALAVQARMDKDAVAADRLRWILRQGARHFLEAGSLLPQPSFKRVHSHRSALKVSEEEAKLMLRSSLAYEDSSLAGATEHWLRRVTDPTARLDVLLEAAFDPCPDVRQRAVKRLSEFPRPEVRSQLHLLALRDSSESVRAQAIDSLDPVKDANLRSSLIQELTDRKSPYRLQAIDALRIFRDGEATETLAGIVGTNTPGQDAAARRRAIEVLGRQETTPSVEALLKITLHDEDNEDREGAARALGSMKTEDTLRLLLERLRRQGRTAKKPGSSISWRSLGASLGHTALAAMAVLLNLILHGLILVTIGRRRLGVVVTLMQGAGAALMVRADDSSAGPIVLAATLLLGWLTPMRILLVERRESRPQSRYRGCLGAFLFAVASITVFLYLHGLACMLAKRVRRGVALIGLEALAVFLTIGWARFDELFAFAAFAQVSPAITWLSTSLGIVGLLLFVTSYVVGVGTVLLDVFLLRTRRELRRRIETVYAHLLRNAAVTSIVLRAFTSQVREDVRWSAEILRRFGREMQQPLRNCWESAAAPARRKLFSVMARHADPASLEFLRRAAPSLGWRARMRCRWAAFAFPLSLWPKPLLAVICLGLYVQLALTAALYALWMNNPTTLLNVVRKPTASVEARTEAVQALRQLAYQQRNHGVSITAASSLASALTLPSTATDQRVREAILHAIVMVARHSEKEEELVAAVGKLLASPDTQASAIDTLRQIGTANAATRLRHFVEGPVSFGLKPKLDPRAHRREVAAKKAAIAALAGMDVGGGEPLRALVALSRRGALEEELKAAAREAAAAIAPLIRAEYYLSGEKYAEAIQQAAEVVATRPADDQRGERAKAVMRKAYLARGATAVGRKDYDAAKADFDAALALGVNDRNVDAVLDLGLYLCVVFHEQRAPAEPRAYGDVYDILLKLREVGGIPAQRLAVEANLVEASLTTGRYDDAYRFAQDLLRGEQLTPSTALNIRFLAYAALVLKRDTSEAAKAGEELWKLYDSLPEGFGNDWTYSGTRSYIEHAALPREDKDILLRALDHIDSRSQGGGPA